MEKIERVFVAVKGLQDNKLAYVANEDHDAFMLVCDVFGLVPNGGAFEFDDEKVCGQWFYTN